MILVKPKLTDIYSMQELVKEDVENGVILYRSDSEIATNIRSYTIAVEKNKIVGYGALHIHSVKLAEIRSLVVSKDNRGRGIGRMLVQKMIQEGRDLAVKEIFTLTYQTKFFEKLGFNIISKELLPEQKIWADCIKCKHFPVCNEESLILNL